MSDQLSAPNSQPATGATPAAPRSEADVADLMFGGTEALVSSYGPAIADSANRLTDHHGWTQEQRDAHVAEMAHAFHDLRIPSEPASRLHSLIAKHAKERPDDATVERWTVESRQQLRERYGIAEADRRMQKAREFLSHRPALAKMLNETGVGSHPDVVLALTEKPHAIRVTPRQASGKKG